LPAALELSQGEKQMKAVQITSFGDPEVMQMVELPDLTPTAGKIVIRTRAIGVNFTDLWARLGMHNGEEPPFIPGMEVSGYIEAVGEDVSIGLQPGMRVIGFTPYTLGGYAEQVEVPAEYVFPFPDAIPFEHAATFTLNYLQAYAALIYMAHIRDQERVLIHAGAGGVGLAAVQLARLSNAEIFATASASKHDFLRSQGVHHPIDYRTLDFEQEVTRITNGSGIDVIIDSIGGESFEKDYRLLRFGGRLVCYGASYAITSKSALPGDIEKTLQPGGIDYLSLEENARAVMGVHLGADPAMLSTWMNDIFALYLSGKIKPHVGRVFPLSEAAQAHHYIHDRKNVGKVLLSVSSGAIGEIQ
jgi:synaptic vesicle membrane protein VAT-1